MLIELSITWIVVVNVIAWPAIQLGLAWGLTRIAPKRFSPDNFFARSRSWERRGRIYERMFGVKVWKDKLPDGAAWFRGGFAKAGLKSSTPEFLKQFASETWRGELVHWLALAALPLFAFWNPWWAVMANACYALAANLPCIIVQRYNRARLCHALCRHINNPNPQI